MSLILNPQVSLLTHPEAVPAVSEGESSGGAGLIGNGPPDGNVASNGTLASAATEGTTWLDDDTDIFYVKKADGTWTAGTSV